MRQMRSVSPRSMTCSGVEPSKAGLDSLSQGPEVVLAENLDLAAAGERLGEIDKVQSLRRFDQSGRCCPDLHTLTLNSSTSPSRTT